MVDGDQNTHATIAERLSKGGCDVLEVEGWVKALSLAQREKPDIAIVDMLTPQLDRSKFVRQLRGNPVVARMPVIFYTSGYLEIATNAVRDMETLLSGILLCQEAINSNWPPPNGSAPAVNGKNGRARDGTDESQQTFTFVSAGPSPGALINPGELISEIVDEARQTFPPSIEITSAYSEDLWPLEGDRLQLRRVLLNLCDKARAAMPAGGSLLVCARNFLVDQKYASMTVDAKPGQYVLLRVSDTGNGASGPVAAPPFPSVRLEKEIGPGTSLDLVKRHGGFISIYSDVSKGNTFQIFLPAKTATAPAPAKQRSKPPRTPLRRPSP